MGHRPIAGQLGVPAATVRGWLRGAAGGGWVAGRLLARAVDADPAARAPPQTGPVATLVVAAQLSARAWSSLSGEPVETWRFAVAVAGGRLLG